MANILVVDDAIFMRIMLKDLLMKEGHTIAGEAANGEQAVALYAELKPDLVILDIVMPVMDGIAAMKEIRRADPAAKIIVCSAMGQGSMVIEAIQAGAKDFILKPFHPVQIFEAINRHIE